MSSPLAYYQSRVPGLHREGGEYRARCPLHRGTTDTSFALDPKTWRWFCHAACGCGGDPIELEMKLFAVPFQKAKAAVEEAMGLLPEDPIPLERARKPMGRIVATYDYHAADGSLSYQVVRLEPKDFRQRRPDPESRDGWTWKVKGLEPLLYHLPEVLANPATVYLAEGEKDADALRDQLGINATCNSGGAKKFKPSMARALAGRNVVILPDDDEAGRQHAEQAAVLLRMEGCRVKVVQLPAHDPFDWLAGGGTRDELAELQAETPEWQPGAVVAPAPEGAPVLGGQLSAAPANVHEMLANYVILVGSDMIWDERLARTTNQAELRLAHARDFNAWARHEDVRKVDIDKLVFKPQGSSPGELNLFKGIRMQPGDPTRCQRMRDHLALLCEGDEAAMDYLTCWLAWPLQHPGAKLRSAIVMHGPQGTGKSLLFETMCRIYGEYADIVGQTEIDSPYTGWASRKLFVVADEVEGNTRFSRTRNRLKALITGDWIGIEEKYRARRIEQNHMNLVFLSNEDTPVVVEQGDRRYSVFYVEQVQEPEYYQRLVDERDDGGDAAFYAYLLAYDTSHFDPNGWPYSTEAKDALVVACASPADRFLNEWAAGELPVPYGCAAASDLYEAYRVWCVTAGEKHGQLSETAFGRTVGKRKWPQERKRFSDRNCRVYAPEGELNGDEAIAFRAQLSEWLERAQARRIL